MNFFIVIWETGHCSPKTHYSEGLLFQKL